MLITTTFSAEPFEIEENLGLCFGIVSKSRNIGSTIGAGLKSIVGGKIGGFEKLANEARDDAVANLKQHAEELKADAIIGMRFDTETIGETMSTVVAYGTAVKLKK
jgi:uncharacterized protein YbjQ (UPF0145 family)